MTLHQTFPKSAVVLVVDDEEHARAMLHRTLRKEGYKVVEASNGKECLEVYQKTQPNIVLLDVTMPRMNGFDCCAQLLAIPGNEHIPVLMITGLGDEASIDRAFAAGATDYVTKPIHWPVLRQRMRVLIEKSRLYEELQILNQTLQQIAATDSLTQVANRRSFDQALDWEWRRMYREQQPLSLILCDVDFFKVYNDTYGHQAGDACLQRVATALSQSVRRPGDVIARYGGEEFVVLLPYTPARGAIAVSQLIQSNVAALAIPHINSWVSSQVTLSLGIAEVIPGDRFSTEMLVTNADKALYQAKAKGRNCFVLA
ncbi:MAG: PleD family two-component system response regulator [Cyanothece sp. SIO1E1]|nr:PleD family two-component system response regulator [Cyanothece sp. SIO1E1]